MASSDDPGRVVYLPNDELYNRWAEVYDVDGNILQAVDDQELRARLFPTIIPSIDSREHLTVCDLGGGTGRASLAFLEQLLHSQCHPRTIDLRVLDASREMLARVQLRLEPAISALQQNHGVVVDLTSTLTDIATVAKTMANDPEADMLYSTLVLEHLALQPFFAAVRSRLRQRGLAIVTNMHPDMGNTALSTTWTPADTDSAATVTGAGFKDAATGRKVRAQVDYAHTVEDTLAAAEEAGLEVLQVDEKSVEEGMVGEGRLLGERGRKWIGVKVWYGLVLRRR